MTWNVAGTRFTLNANLKISSHPFNLPRVVVLVTTYNHRQTILPCLRSILTQEHYIAGENLHLVVIDNASTDGVADLVASNFADCCTLLRNTTNQGFTGAANKGLQLLEEFQADYLMLVNPDLALAPSALFSLVQELAADSSAGTACPKILRADAQLKPLEPNVIDAAGMFFTPQLRHLDRGSAEADRGQYETTQYVFGGSGAALLLRRNFMLDVSFLLPSHSPPQRLFDDAFFAYREDAELAWRGLWLGWKCRYVPQALAYHVRHVLPEGRARLAPEINLYSVRNRFLMQLNNFSPSLLHCIVPGALRNLTVLAAVILQERSSLPALRQVLTNLKPALAKRRMIFRRKRLPAAYLAPWFSKLPYAQPALEANRTAARLQSLRIVIVNYNSGSRLGECLKSISQALQELRLRYRVLVVIVDNASQDGSATRLLPLFAGLNEFSFNCLEHNLGFAGGVNAGCVGLNEDCILILNPDIRLSAEAVDVMAEDMRRFSQLAAVAPRLVGLDGKEQIDFSVRSLPTLGSTLCELFFLHRFWPSNPWTRRYLVGRNPLMRRYLAGEPVSALVPHQSPERPVLIEQPAAACLLLRAEAYRKVGGFDEQFWPAWFEDVDFCKRLVEAGFCLGVEAKAEVRHEGGYSREVLGDREFLHHWYVNMSRYWQKHGSAWERAIISFALSLAIGLRVVCFALLGIAAALRGAECRRHFSVSAGLLGRLFPRKSSEKFSDF